MKRSLGKKDNEGIEYICRVNLEDLRSLMTNIKKLCLFILFFQATTLAGSVSCDMVRFSVSFNEYLRLVSIQRRADPDEETLLDMFQ